MRAMEKPQNEDNIMQCSGKVGTFCIRKSHSSPVHASSNPVLLQIEFSIFIFRIYSILRIQTSKWITC